MRTNGLTHNGILTSIEINGVTKFRSSKYCMVIHPCTYNCANHLGVISAPPLRYEKFGSFVHFECFNLAIGKGHVAPSPIGANCG